MKKLILCGLLLTSLFTFRQTVNVTDADTRISYRTTLFTDDSGHTGFILNDDIISTPPEIIDVIEGRGIQWPINVVKGPRTYSTVTLGNGQEGR